MGALADEPELTLQQSVEKALANSTDGTGNYLFSGYRTSTQPFIQDPEARRYK